MEFLPRELGLAALLVEPAEPVMGLGKIGVELDRQLVLLDSLGVLPFIFIEQAQFEVGIGIIGI